MIPKHELVVVFTSHVMRKKIGVVIDLVKNYIIPAVRTLKPLPDNETATNTLESKIESFMGI